MCAQKWLLSYRQSCAVHCSESFWYAQLILWCLALAFIGVFIAVPLRTQTIIKEQLTFPSGCKTCQISMSVIVWQPIIF